MAEYLFLVEQEDGWTQASIDGLPLSCTNPSEHFDGNMPRILATEYLTYKKWDDHVEESVRDFEAQS